VIQKLKGVIQTRHHGDLISVLFLLWKAGMLKIIIPCLSLEGTVLLSKE